MILLILSEEGKASSCKTLQPHLLRKSIMNNDTFFLTNCLSDIIDE